MLSIKLTCCLNGISRLLNSDNRSAVTIFIFPSSHLQFHAYQGLTSRHTDYCIIDRSTKERLRVHLGVVQFLPDKLRDCWTISASFRPSNMWIIIHRTFHRHCKGMLVGAYACIFIDYIMCLVGKGLNCRTRAVNKCRWGILCKTRSILQQTFTARKI